MLPLFTPVLSANSDFTPPFGFCAILPYFLKMKFQFAPILLKGVNGVKFVEKDRYSLCDFALVGPPPTGGAR